MRLLKIIKFLFHDFLKALKDSVSLGGLPLSLTIFYEEEELIFIGCVIFKIPAFCRVLCN